ncbi:lysophospholipase L1-like esterase [Haloactinospora alba]|uniref:Lysophospholipase L1-like esterase n=1 Tax=Haloactinospora alba TaxID=405555 RepID=A0A543NL60_9ACTN|nr:SGNH/GDSL hydrolase family protein [Haloactinospora alba]TQN32561.1 lysophospholipase L1-like esterase [Haloactinospora alba]
MNAALLRCAQVVVWASVPVLLPQGMRVRATTPVLPEARGMRGKAAGDSERRPLDLLVLGDSTAAGVGVSHHGDGVAGHLAAALAERSGRGVAWRVVARSGATVGGVERRHLPAAVDGPPPDVAVVLAGVNDTLRLTRLATVRATMARILTELRRNHPDTRVLLSGTPPLHRFPALPAPTRQVLGLRARAVDRAVSRAAGDAPGAVYVPVPDLTATAGVFAADGFHPGSGGYRAWARRLASHCDLP